MDFCLNYVWLGNKSYYDPAGYASGSPIPAEYINNLFRIAAALPKTPVFLWCDLCKMPPEEIRFLEGLRRKPPTLTLRDLNEIARYKKSALFQKSQAANPFRLWQQVDLSRLFVLHHILAYTPAKAAFYADFDIRDPGFDDAPIQGPLSRFGFLFALHGGVLENSFMGFARAQRTLLSAAFIPETVASYRGDNVARINGWSAFCDVANQVCRRQGLTLDDCAIPVETLGKGPLRMTFDKRLAIVGEGVPEPPSPKRRGLLSRLAFWQQAGTV